MKKDLVYIILLNYNGYSDTIACVQSLRKVTYESFKIVVVDNASTDDSEKILRRELGDCTIIQSGSNEGFAHGNNIGIEYALDNGADYVLLLNNDTTVEPDFLERMVDNFTTEEVGLVGSKIKYYSEPEYLWFAGGGINWFKFISEHYHVGKRDSDVQQAKAKVEFVTGCCMLISAKALKDVGLLPEFYFMYYEDVDYCVRLKEKGYEIIYEPEAVIYHKVGMSAGGEESAFAIKWTTRNRLVFMRLYKNKVSKITFFFSRLFFYTSRIIKYFQYYVKSKDKARALLQGIKEGIKENKKIYKV